MTCKKSTYKNIDKFLITRKKQNKKYYSKHNYSDSKHKLWTEQERELLFSSELCDVDLAKYLKRSLKAMQQQRQLCKKKDKSESK